MAATESTLSSSSTTSLPATSVLSSPSFPSAHHLLSIKLSSSNYLIWKKQIEPLLKGQGLFGYLDGSLQQPADATAAAAWQRQDSQLVSLLVSSLSEDLVPLLIDKETSSRSTLKEAFGSASSTRIMSLTMDIQHLLQKPDEPVTSLLRRAKNIADELSASGNPLTPTQFNLHVLRALCDDLQDVVSGVLNRTSPPSYTEVHGLLLSHESMRAFRKLSVVEAAPSSNPTVNVGYVCPSNPV